MTSKEGKDGLEGRMEKKDDVGEREGKKMMVWERG